MHAARALVLIAALAAAQPAFAAGLSEGGNGRTAPGSTTQIGSQDGSGNLQPASPSNPLPTYDSAAGPGTATSYSGTITLGGTAQTAVAANTARKLAICENSPAATENLYISLTAVAAVNSANDFAELAPGGSATIPGTSAISVIGATTGHRFYCTEWQ